MSSKASARPEQSTQPSSGDSPSSDIKALLDRIQRLAIAKSAEAWAIFNILSFMIEALPHDSPEGLPTQCTLVDLKKRAEVLASELGDLADEVRHG